MGSQFLADRCAVVDRDGSNVLIRGNMPLIGADNHYAIEEIRAASGVDDLLNRMIIEVPIIDNVGERDQFEALCRAFGIYADSFPASMWPPYGKPGYDPNSLLGWSLETEGYNIPGHMLWRPFEGLPDNTQADTYLNAPLWDFSGFIDRIEFLMHNLVNAAIYVHCQLGADRTGAFHIGYLMKVMGYPLHIALSVAQRTTKAHLRPNADYMRLVEAYALKLHPTYY